MSTTANGTAEVAPKAHLEHPAVVVNLVEPAIVPSATAMAILQQFETEVYPPEEGEPPQFLSQFSEWGPVPCVATMAFPREGVPRLSEICAQHHAVLVRGVLTAVSADLDERVPFDYATAVSDIMDSVPDEQDVYTFGVRTSPDTPLIVCGLHVTELSGSQCFCAGAQ